MKKISFKIVLPVFVLITSSNTKNEISKIDIPDVFINADQNNFQTKQGLTFLNQQPFSGWQYALYENGDTALLVPFYNGKESGVAKQWYPNTILKERREYEMGKKTGEHKGWWENGQLKFDYHFNNDLYDGTVKEWYADGQAFRAMNYVNGYEKGMQKIWRPDGSLHANYEARNGRNYGLTGNMHCKNIRKDGM
jgi:antitoxin component YwqK of YwqJK toxin-antitoxin module